jgi:hypothetical protein
MTGLTVEELRKRLQGLEAEGLGDALVMVGESRRAGLYETTTVEVQDVEVTECTDHGESTPETRRFVFIYTT